MGEEGKDRQVQRTRKAILDAFGLLFFANGYDGVDVKDVASRANVGRSTFYRHFRSKEDLLVQSLEPLFAHLADCCVSEDQPPGLTFIVQHFWDNRRLARAVFTGRSMAFVVRSLEKAIEQRLATQPAYESRLPAPLIAAHLAAGHMAMLDGWLRGRGTCLPTEFSCVLHRTSRSVVRAAMS